VTTGKVILVTVLAGALSLGAAIFGQRWLDLERAKSPSGVRGAGTLQSLPDFQLPDLTGRQIQSSTWAGKVLVLNFWATWCPPCRRELPLFVEVQKRYGATDLQVVGIAIDAKDEVKGYLSQHPVNYPILIGDTQAIELSRQLGDRLEGLPFTVIFDRFGKRMYSQLGEVTHSILQEQLVPLLPDRARVRTSAN
jgi:thiol-disulfide isomerase/thioredoxin